MLHTRTLEVYIHFTLMYTIDHISPVLPFKDLINKDSVQATPYKLATGMKTLILNLCVLFFLCVVKKATAHVETKLLNMHCQAQKFFCGTFVGVS